MWIILVVQLEQHVICRLKGNWAREAQDDMEKIDGVSGSS